jgi:hypothetical protein
MGFMKFTIIWVWRLISTVSAAGWMGIIFYLSSYSPVDLLPRVEQFSWLGKWREVVGHLVLYGVLGALLLITLWSWVVASSHKIKWALVAICLGILYGVLDEYHQSFVPGRTATAIDVFVDVLGVTIGVMGSSWLRYLGNKRTLVAEVARNENTV